MTGAKLVIWDLDGTLYPKDTLYFETDFQAMGEIISAMGVMEYADAYVKAEESKKKYGATFDIFLKEYDVDFDSLEKAFTEKMLEKVDFIKPNAELENLIRDVNAYHAVYSHAAFEWMEAVLDRLGLAGVFGKGARFSANRLGGGNVARKRGTDDGFMAILKAFSLRPEETVVVDDEYRNLEIPRAVGMDVALIEGDNLYFNQPLSEFKVNHYDSAIDFIRKYFNK